MHNSSNVLHMM